MTKDITSINLCDRLHPSIYKNIHSLNCLETHTHGYVGNQYAKYGQSSGALGKKKHLNMKLTQSAYYSAPGQLNLELTDCMKFNQYDKLQNLILYYLFYFWHKKK
jgi:hypothetical protein